VVLVLVKIYANRFIGIIRVFVVGNGEEFAAAERLRVDQSLQQLDGSEFSRPW